MRAQGSAALELALWRAGIETRCRGGGRRSKRGWRGRDSGEGGQSIEDGAEDGGGVGEGVGDVLHSGGEDVFALGGQGRVEDRGNDHLDGGWDREGAAFGLIPGALEGDDVGREHERAAESGCGERLEGGESVEGEVDAGDVAPVLDVTDRAVEFGDIRRGDEPREGRARVVIGEDQGRGEEIACGEANGAGEPTPSETSIRSGPGTKRHLGAGRSRRGGE